MLIQNMEHLKLVIKLKIKTVKTTNIDKNIIIDECDKYLYFTNNDNYILKIILNMFTINF